MAYKLPISHCFAEIYTLQNNIIKLPKRLITKKLKKTIQPQPLLVDTVTLQCQSTPSIQAVVKHLMQNPSRAQGKAKLEGILSAGELEHFNLPGDIYDDVQGCGHEIHFSQSFPYYFGAYANPNETRNMITIDPAKIPVKQRHYYPIDSGNLLRLQSIFAPLFITMDAFNFPAVKEGLYKRIKELNLTELSQQYYQKLLASGEITAEQTQAILTNFMIELMKPTTELDVKFPINLPEFAITGKMKVDAIKQIFLYPEDYQYFSEKFPQYADKYVQLTVAPNPKGYNMSFLTAYLQEFPTVLNIIQQKIGM